MLIQAAAGGVGLLLTPIAKMRGATVIGTCSTNEKAKAIRAVGGDVYQSRGQVCLSITLIEKTGYDEQKLF